MLGGRVRLVALRLPVALALQLAGVVVLVVSVRVWHHDHNRAPSTLQVIRALAVWVGGAAVLAFVGLVVAFAARRVVVRRERRRALGRRDRIAVAALVGTVVCVLAAPEEVLWDYGCNSAGGTTSQWGRLVIDVAHPRPDG